MAIGSQYAPISRLTLVLTRRQREALQVDARRHCRHSSDHATWIVLRHLGLVDADGGVCPVTTDTNNVGVEPAGTGPAAETAN